MVEVTRLAVTVELMVLLVDILVVDNVQGIIDMLVVTLEVVVGVVGVSGVGGVAGVVRIVGVAGVVRVVGGSDVPMVVVIVVVVLMVVVVVVGKYRSLRFVLHSSVLQTQ